MNDPELRARSDQPVRALAFLLCVLVLVFAVDRLVSHALDAISDRTRTGPSGGKINYFISLPETPEIAIVGSSKAAHDVAPASFHRPAFNLGHDGSFLLFADALIHLLQDQHRLSPVILLHVDQKLFIKPGQEVFIQSDLRTIKLHYGRDPWVTHYIDSRPFVDRAKFLLRTYRFNGIWMSMMKAYLETFHPIQAYDGYEPIAAAPYDAERIRNEVDALKARPDEIAIPDDASLEFLRDIVDVCRKEHVRLICYTAPDFMDRADYHRRVRAMLDTFLASEEVPYLDFNRTREEALSNITLWKDSTHLNASGAKIFSDLLAEKVEAMLVAAPLAETSAEPTSGLASVPATGASDRGAF